MSNRLTVPTAVGLAVITLIIGAAIGSLVFPIARTTTETLVTTKTTTNSILSTVTSEITHTTNTSFGTTSSSETTFTSTVSTTTDNTLVSTTTAPTTDVIFPQGTTFQVQSSYDCVAGHYENPFNVSTTSSLGGAINASQPGVTVYVATAQDAQSVAQGHPSSWIYSSGLTNSTNFNVSLQPGSYVLWIEGADLACGATIVTPLEQLTTVTVIQSIVLTSTTA